MAVEFDLLGDPIPESRGKAGRTGHIPTSENAMRVRALLAAGLGVERIAQELGVTAPTLRKHYFRNGKVNFRQAREMALAESKARQILRLEQAAEAGNVGAMKTLHAIYERAELDMLPAQMRRPQAKADEPLGKKERLKREAQKPTGGWASRLPGMGELPN